MLVLLEAVGGTTRTRAGRGSKPETHQSHARYRRRHPGSRTWMHPDVWHWPHITSHYFTLHLDDADREISVPAGFPRSRSFQAPAALIS